MITKKHIDKIKEKIANKPIGETHMYISYSTVEKLISKLDELLDVQEKTK